MKKAGVFIAVAASLYFCLPTAATLSYLTSEKNYAKPISMGTNKDVFEVSAESITLETKVNKKVSVKKEKNEDGSTKESSQVKTSVSLGSQVIFFYPGRPDIFITPKNFKVVGLPSKAISVEIATMPEGNEGKEKKGLAFRIAHTLDSVEWESTLKKGELQIQALGGFYDLRIPIKLVNIYNEETVVEEVVVPPNNPPTGGGGTPTEPPPTGDGGGTPTEPPTGGTSVPMPSGANMVAADK